MTLLVPEDRRDRANGMVGTVTGLSFAITSVFSGLVIGQLGTGWALYGSLALTVAALVHINARLSESMSRDLEAVETASVADAIVDAPTMF